MLHWMKARRYRHARSTILTSITVGMIAQACFVPQLLAQDRAERLAEEAAALREREYRLEIPAWQSVGEQQHRTNQFLRTTLQSMLRYKSEDGSVAYEQARGDLEYLAKRSTEQLDRLRLETSRLRDELIAAAVPASIVKNLDDFTERQQGRHVEIERAVRTALRAGTNAETLGRALRQFDEAAPSGRPVRPAPDDAPGRTPLPRRVRTAQDNRVSTGAFTQYPWRIASLDPASTVGDLFTLLTTPDCDSTDPDLAPSLPEISFYFVDRAPENFDCADEDLAGEYPLTALARCELGGDPVAIFEYVRNELTYEPYFGSLKGARRTLEEGSGNDLDLASVLVSMLRAAGFPARLTFGTIELTIEEASSWLGISDPTAIANLLQRGGIPAELVLSPSGAASAIRVDHVWVSAHLDLEPFRGAGGMDEDLIDTWVDLDPSFKRHVFAGEDIVSSLGMSPQGLFGAAKSGAIVDSPSSPTDLGSIDEIDDDLLRQELLSQAGPVRSLLAARNARADTVFRSRVIAEDRFGLVPITDLYRIATRGVSLCGVPDELKHRIRFSVLHPDAADPTAEELQIAYPPVSPNGTDPTFSEGIEIAAIVGRPIVLTYAPNADSIDLLQSAVDPSFVDDYAAALLDVSPQLRILPSNPSPHDPSVGNPEILVASTDLLKSGGTQTVIVEFKEPGDPQPGQPEWESNPHPVIIGGVHSFVLNAQSIPESELEQRRSALGVGALSPLPFRGEQELPAWSYGVMLDAIGRSYFKQAERFGQMAEGATGVEATRLPSVVRASWELRTPDTTEPTDLTQAPLALDVVRDLQAVAHIDAADSQAAAEAEASYIMLTSLLSNALEGAALQQSMDGSTSATVLSSLKKQNLSDNPTPIPIATIPPQVSVSSPYPPELLGLPAFILNELEAQTAFEREVTIVTAAIELGDASERDYYGMIVRDAVSGANAFYLFDKVTEQRVSAELARDDMLSTAGLTADDHLPTYRELLGHVPQDGTRDDRLHTPMGQASEWLRLLDDATDATGLWYVPAAAYVNDWLRARQDIDPTTIPMCALMVAQPIDQFANQPSVLNVAVASSNDVGGPDWIGHHNHVHSYDGVHDPNANVIRISGDTTRANQWDITIKRGDGLIVDALTTSGTDPGDVGSFDQNLVFFSSITDVEDGTYTYEIVASNDTTGTVLQSVPVTGSFGVDLTRPDAGFGAIDTPNTGGPLPDGVLLIEGYATDDQSFDRMRVTLNISNGNSLVVHDSDSPAPDLDGDPARSPLLAAVDTTTSDFNGASEVDVILEAWDSAGNRRTVTEPAVQLENPPPVDGVDGLTATVAIATAFAGSEDLLDSVPDVISDAGVSLQLSVDTTLAWPAITNDIATYPDGLDGITGISQIDVLINGNVIESIPVSPPVSGASSTLGPFTIDDAFASLTNTQAGSSADDHELTVRAHISHPEAPAVVSAPAVTFDCTYYLSDVRITPSIASHSNRVLEVTGTRQIISSAWQWEVAVHDAPGELVAYGLHGFNGVPHGPSTGNTGRRYGYGDDPVTISFAVDEFNGHSAGIHNNGLADGDFEFVIRVVDANDDAVDLQPEFRLDFRVDSESNPIARIANVSDKIDLPPSDELKYLELTEVTDGFFGLTGFAYDEDTEQSDVRYRVELRKANNAWFSETEAEEYHVSGVVGYRSGWIAYPPDDNPESDAWTVRPSPSVELDYENAGWRELGDGGQLRPGPVPEHLLANLDLTALPDGEYQVVLAVRSGQDPDTRLDIDLKQLVVNSPAKVGRFTFSQEDVSRPALGLPVTLVRTYDSLRRNEDGPFGLGWSMALYDLDITVNESRSTLDSAYFPKTIGTILSDGNLPISASTLVRNSGLIDRTVTLTLPTGERVTFPFRLEQKDNPPKLYPVYDSPAGMDQVTLELLDNERIMVIPLLEPYGFYWELDGATAPEHHHDFRGWKLTTEDDVVYTILREKLADPSTFNLSGESAIFSVGTVWGDPYVSRIELPTGERIDLERDDTTYQLEGIKAYAPGDLDSDGSLATLGFQYEGEHITAVLDEDGGDPLYIYEYDSHDQLTHVYRRTSPDAVFIEQGTNATAWDPDDLADVDHNSPTVFEYEDPTATRGLITQIKDPRGLQPVLSEYDEAGRLVATTDAYGRRIAIERDLENRTETVTDFGTASSNYASYTIYSYDERGNVVREENSANRIVTRQYNDDDLVTEEWDAARTAPTLFDYDDRGNQAVVQDPLGNVTRTSYAYYGALPRRIETTVEMRGDASDITTLQEFDSNGNLTRTVSSSNITENEYDDKNRLEQVLVQDIDESTGVPTGSMRTASSYSYDSANPALLSEVTQHVPNGGGTDEISSEFFYDNLGRQFASSRTEDSKKVVDFQQYDVAGRVTGTWRATEYTGSPWPPTAGDSSAWETGGAIHLTTTYYDAIDQVIAAVDHTTGSTTTTIYDARGNVIETARWAFDLEDWDETNRDGFLGWLKKPDGTGAGTLPEMTNATWATGVNQGALVTRTVYNDRGQTAYSATQTFIAEADYPTMTSGVSGTQTVYDEHGRVIETHRVSGLTINLGTVTLPTNPAVPGDNHELFTAESNNPTSDAKLSSTIYDDLGRVERTTALDQSDGVSTVTTRYYYDENDRQTEVRVLADPGSTDDDMVTQFEYDDAGRQTAVIDPRDNRVEYRYDAEGRRTHTVFGDPDDAGFTHAARTVYDARGRRIEEIDQEGHIRRFRYDHANRLTKVILEDPTPDEPGTIEYAYEYDTRGNLTKITDPKDQETTLAYDHLGRRISRTLPDGTSTELWVYDDAEGPGYGKLKYHQMFAGELIAYEYDVLGRLEFKKHYTATTIGATDVTDANFDHTSPLLAVEREYQHEYDEYGRLAQLDRIDANAGNRTTAWVYDDDGRVTKLYTNEGIITYEYDSATGRHIATRTYDGQAGGNLNSGIRTTAYKYDRYGRLATVAVYSDADESKTYDPDVVDPSLTMESGRWDYTYDAAGSRESLVYTPPTGPDIHTLYDYDILGRLTAVEHHEGTPDSIDSLISAYLYDHNPDGRRSSVQEIRAESGSGHSLVTVDYEYDDLGRLTGEDSTPSTPGSFALPASQQSVSVLANHEHADERHFERTYAYDTVGNRLSRLTNDLSANDADEFVEYEYYDTAKRDQLHKAITHAGLNNLGSVTETIEHDYDANGFMTERRVLDENGNTDWTHQYEQSIEDRIGSYTRLDDAGATDITVDYDYNASGIRVSATPSAGAARHFLIDPNNHTGYAQVIAERAAATGSTTTVKHYAIGDDVLAQRRGSNWEALLADGHGSTRQLVQPDPVLDPIIERYDFDAYGQAFGLELDDPDSLEPRPLTDLLYAGEQWDAQIGMQYLRARHYMPGQGVFNRLDPFFGSQQDPQSFHKYAYVHGDPVGNTDPSGLTSLVKKIAVAGITSALISFVFNIPALVRKDKSWKQVIVEMAISGIMGIVLGPLMGRMTAHHFQAVARFMFRFRGLKPAADLIFWLARTRGGVPIMIALLRASISTLWLYIESVAQGEPLSISDLSTAFVINLLLAGSLGRFDAHGGSNTVNRWAKALKDRIESSSTGALDVLDNRAIREGLSSAETYRLFKQHVFPKRATITYAAASVAESHTTVATALSFANKLLTGLFKETTY